jgi:hypothetical protein
LQSLLLPYTRARLGLTLLAVELPFLTHPLPLPCQGCASLSRDPLSLNVCTALHPCCLGAATLPAHAGDANMRTLAKGDIIQLERKGYYIVDEPALVRLPVCQDMPCPACPYQADLALLLQRFVQAGRVLGEQCWALCVGPGRVSPLCANNLCAEPCITFCADCCMLLCAAVRLRPAAPPVRQAHGAVLHPRRPHQEHDQSMRDRSVRWQQRCPPSQQRAHRAAWPGYAVCSAAWGVGGRDAAHLSQHRVDTGH